MATKIKFAITLSTEEVIEVTGKVIEELPTGKVKVEYKHPVQGLMRKIVTIN